MCYCALAKFSLPCIKESAWVLKLNEQDRNVFLKIFFNYWIHIQNIIKGSSRGFRMSLNCIAHNALFYQLPSKSDNYLNYQSSPDRVGVSAADSHARDPWFEPRLWQHLSNRRRITALVSFQFTTSSVVFSLVWSWDECHMTWFAVVRILLIELCDILW